MDELERGGRGAGGREAIAQPVLHRLHIVVGAPFDGLDGLAGIDGHLARQRLGGGDDGRWHTRSGGEAGRSLADESDEPCRLHPDPGADQGRFGQMLAQWIGTARIATIDRREGVEGVGLHG